MTLPKPPKALVMNIGEAHGTALLVDQQPGGAPAKRRVWRAEVVLTVFTQFRIDDGHALTFTDPEPRGHSFEFRINGEDPGRGFLPAPRSGPSTANPRLCWIGPRRAGRFAAQSSTSRVVRPPAEAHGLGRGGGRRTHNTHNAHNAPNAPNAPNSTEWAIVFVGVRGG